MEEALPSPVNYKEVLKRRAPLGLIAGAVLVLVTLALALGLPSLYRSRAVILIEQQEIPQDLVRSLMTSYADQRMQVISQRVLTSSNLRDIIQKYNLYADKREREPMERVVEEMREDVSILPISADVVDPKQGKAVKATIAFELAYENESPELAQRVANELSSLFLNENLKQRSETSQETLGFLTTEADRLREEVATLEQKLADFKEKNVSQLPELTNLNLELMNRTDNEIMQIDNQVRSLEQQRVYLESELAQQSPNSLLVSDTGQRILGPADRLKVLESEFIPLAARYGANHPDVVAKRREIESLRAEVGAPQGNDEIALRLQQARTALAEARQKYGADHPDIKQRTREVASLQAELDAANRQTPRAAPKVNTPPDNPAYIQLQARLDATGAEIRSLQGQRAALRAKRENLEQRITATPQVEREYRMLTRDYEIAQAKYQEVLAKRQEADLASTLESRQQGERFTMIEPPVIPEEPAKPNRLAIGVLGMLLSMAGAVGSGALAETLDERLYGRAGVVRQLGVPPLAVIPRLHTDATRRQRSRNLLLWVAGGVLALVLAAIALHVLFRPLDVLFFQVLRVLGL